MRKVLSNGRIIIKLDEKEEKEISDITNKDTPSNKEIITLLKQIINILLS